MNLVAIGWVLLYFFGALIVGVIGYLLILGLVLSIVLIEVKIANYLARVDK